VLLLSTAATAEDSWPRFGGPSANFSVSQADLAQEWPKTGPPLLWEQDLGPGYSAIAASSTAVFTLYRDGDDEIAVAFDAALGTSRWKHRYSAPAREGHAVQFGTGPHATPLLLDDRVITLGYTGELRALDLETGELLWQHHLLDDLGGDLLQWGYSASPIAYGNDVIVLVGGKAGAIAFDPANGKPRWKSPATSISYAAPLVVSVEGKDQLLYFAKYALHAIDPAQGGSSLWKTTIKNGYSNHASMPIWLGDGRLWVVSQQEAGARVLRLGHEDGKATVQQEWQDSKIRIHHWNSIRIENTAYGTIGDSVQILAGIDLSTGKVLWRDRTFGMANLVHTPSGTVLLNDSGELALVDLSRKGVTIKARAQIADGVTWTVPTLVGSRLFVRDKEKIRAFELGPQKKKMAVEAAEAR